LIAGDDRIGEIISFEPFAVVDSVDLIAPGDHRAESSRGAARQP
jgi:hypothetical protein